MRRLFVTLDGARAETRDFRLTLHAFSFLLGFLLGFLAPGLFLASLPGLLFGTQIGGRHLGAKAPRLFLKASLAALLLFLLAPLDVRFAARLVLAPDVGQQQIRLLATGRPDAVGLINVLQIDFLGGLRRSRMPPAVSLTRL